MQLQNFLRRTKGNVATVSRATQSRMFLRELKLKPEDCDNIAAKLFSALMRRPPSVARGIQVNSDKLRLD
jgi:hypothetical protein